MDSFSGYSAVKNFFDGLIQTKSADFRSLTEGNSAEVF